MKKLREIIVNAHEYGKIPRGFTPYMIYVLKDIYNDLLLGKEAGFIESEINDLLIKCGINTRQQGIGWVAYR